MSRTRLSLVSLIIFVISIFSGFLSERIVLSNDISRHDAGHTCAVVNKRLQKVDSIIATASELISGTSDSLKSNMFTILEQYNGLFDSDELSLLVTKNDVPVYWSDNMTTFIPNINQMQPCLIQLPNGWYLLERDSVDGYEIDGLVFIKYDYQIKNDYLRNRFSHGLGLPENFEVLSYKSEYAIPITRNDGTFLFSVKPPSGSHIGINGAYIPTAFYLLAFLTLLLILYRARKNFLPQRPAIKLLLLLVALAMLYFLMNIFHLPKSFYVSSLFSPEHFAYSELCASLGEFLLLAVLLFFWMLNFMATANEMPVKNNGCKSKNIFLVILSIAVSALYFVASVSLIKILVMNSSVSPIVYQASETNIFSIVGMFSICLIVMSYVLFSFGICRMLKGCVNYKVYFVTLLVFSFAVLFWSKSVCCNGFIIVWLAFLLFTGSKYVIDSKNLQRHNLTVILIYSSVLTLFTLFVLLHFVDESEEQFQRLMSVNLSEEHDPIAETYLIDIDPRIKADTVIAQKIDESPVELADYISQKFFMGYFREYDIQITVCHPDDSLIIHPSNELYACYPFFDDIFENKGFPLADINFRFIENNNGRITYMGCYECESISDKARIYIELNSRMLSEGSGFPELLLPRHSVENRMKKHFSFAKYNDGELVDRGGSFLYPLTTALFDTLNSGISISETRNGNIHCILNQGNGNFVVMSRPKIKFVDYLMSFPYIFLILFLLYFFADKITSCECVSGDKGASLRRRIQVTIIGAVLLTILIVGGGTIAFNVWQYNSEHQKALIEKTNSISEEIDQLIAQIGDVEAIDPLFLTQELLRISEVFWIDINIYNFNGQLWASSRPEVFDKGLMSHCMDNDAYVYMTKYRPTRYINRVHIGSMKYLSSYTPLLDGNDNCFGFINIPYFTHEQKFQQQIATFIMAFVNIYLLLLVISILMAYYISGRITDPLKMIRESMRDMQLGKDSKPISYKSNDEIGLLVSEYNNKLEELAQSAELLARNERESAWREMAKQIAHEIKNPLTPMKLNIQFLQRIGTQSNDVEYQNKVNRITVTLIEQIDNLSGIASAFSDFAKMPNAQTEEFDLTQRLHETIGLYENTGQCVFNVNLDNSEKLMVRADKEQLSRVFINLIRNAIQAIPEGVDGKIDVSIERDGDNALVSVADNGKGIDDSLRESIFEPNFTTKSSGTGLGLAISKRIVQNASGDIWFESELNKGSVFYVKIPLSNHNC